MSKFSILNLVLFVVVISLAFIIYFSEEQSTQLERLTHIDLNDITSINIQHNKNTTTIVKQPGKQQTNQWKITQPVSVAANDFRINSILKVLNAPVHNKYALSEIDISTTGLDIPATTVQFNNDIIAFGIINPATNLRYIKLNNIVYTIEDVYYPMISSHFGTLVSLNLLPLNSTVEKLILVNQTISKDDNGLWRSNIEMSADNIAKTIDHWQHDQAFGVHEYMQREELGEVFVYLKNQEQPLAYSITDTDPWLIIARPEIGLEYHLDSQAYNNLIEP